MPRPVDLKAIKARTEDSLGAAKDRFVRLAGALEWNVTRWVADMTAVELHAIWERYVEQRLVAAINHNPQSFLEEYGVRGVTRIPAGLAVYLARQGKRYFDFRSTSDLIARGDHLVSESHNPFRRLPATDRSYLDALSAVRNFVVHRSEAAGVAYRRALKSVYGIKYAPETGEFLSAIDHRASSPARRLPRLHGLFKVVTTAVTAT